MLEEMKFFDNFSKWMVIFITWANWGWY